MERFRHGHEEEAWGSECVAKGTGRISEGIRSLVEGRTEAGLAYNLVGDAAKLGLSMSGLGNKHDKLKKDETMISLAVSTLERPRASLSSMASTLACASSSPSLSQPFTVTRSSATRITQMGGHKRRGCGRHRPKTGVHASANPFESLAERANWLGMPLKSDNFGRAMLATRVFRTTIKAWCDDLDVPYQGKAQSWFDLVDDSDSRDCLRKNASIYARFCMRRRVRRFAQAGAFARCVRE